MPMDPSTLLALVSLVSNVGAGMTGNQGERGSTYSPQAQSTIEGILNDLKGMKGGAQDITKNPQYQQGADWLSNLFGNDQGFWNKFESPLLRNYQENIIPDLANRFASMGSGGATGSTAFRNALGREGTNLQTNLAALRGGMQQQGVNQALQYAQQPTSNYLQLLQQSLVPTMNQYQPPSAGPFGGIASASTSALLQSLVNKAGTPGQYPGTT